MKRQITNCYSNWPLAPWVHRMLNAHQRVSLSRWAEHVHLTDEWTWSRRHEGKL